MKFAIVHEMAHNNEFSENFSKYRDGVENSSLFKEWVENKAKGLTNSTNYESKRAAVRKSYKKTYSNVKALSNTQAFNEMYADFAADVIFNSKDLNGTISQLEKSFKDKNAFRRFVQAIMNCIRKIKGYFNDKGWDKKVLQNEFVKLQKSVENKSLDNNNKTKYNINRGENNARTDEFRRLQEASRRMSDEEIQLYHSGNKQIDDGIRRRFSRSVKQIFLETYDDGIGYAKRVLSVNSKGNEFNIVQDVDGTLFHNIFEVSRNYLKYGELVDLHSIKSTDDEIGYDDCKNYLTDDGLSGFSITPDGDLISVFNLNNKRGFLRAISGFVKKNAKTLDCYASPEQNLKDIYSTIFGFKTASLMDYNMEYDHDSIAENHNNPQVAFMLKTDKDIETKHFSKDEYDKALEYRNSLLENDTSFSISPERNAEYMKAAESGNEAECQRLVDEAAEKQFANSKVRGDDGKLLKVYHGTDSNFNVFDRTKSRANMDIQGNFFSPWKLDAQGYGSNVRAFYLNIENPASEGVGYSALRRFQGQNYAGKKAREYLESLKYDGVNNENEEFISFNSNQIKSADPITYDDDGNIIPLSGRFNESNDDIRFSVDDDLKNLNDEYGTIPKGMNAERDIDVPKKTSDKKHTSYVARSIMEKGSIDEDTLESIKDRVINEALSHKRLSDKEALDYADKQLQDGEAERIWNSVANGKATPSKKNIAVGEALLEMYANEHDAEKVLNLTSELCEVGTRAGQTVQAFSLLKNMGGVGRLYYLQKSVNKLNENIEKKFGDKKERVKISNELAEQIMEANSEQEVTEAAQEIMKSLSEQVPATFLDKWNAWRYLSMLGSPRTHNRNLIGNTIFTPVVEMKNGLATAMEKFIPEEERTKAVVIKKGTASFANKDFNKMKEYIANGGKYNDTTEIESNRKIFKFKPLEALRKLNFDALEAEDALFLRYHYVRAMSQFLSARNVDVNNISEKTLNDARNYAMLEAQKATYRDASEMANLLSRISNSKVLPFNIWMQGNLPFTKTTTNIIRRSLEYSPVGVLKTLTFDIRKLRKGDINISEFIDDLSSGLTGTGIFALGMFLSQLGVISIGFGGDDDEWFKKLNGEQEFSIRIGDASYTIDWAAPVCIPFFMGATFNEKMKEENDNWFSAFTNSIGASFEPLINLSMMQGISDTLNGVRYSKNMISALALNGYSSYFTQIFPTILGQLTRVVDEKRRQNYIDKSSPIPMSMQRILNTFSGKAFNVTGRKPYVDAWGNEDISTGIANRILQNMVSPGYYSEVNYDKVNTEMQRLYNIGGDKTILPDNVNKYIMINGEKKNLTADEYTKYQTEAGKNAYNYIDKLINTDVYKKANNETKIKMIKKIYSYADSLAKTSVSDYRLSSTEQKINLYEKNGVGLDKYFADYYKNKSDSTSESVEINTRKVTNTAQGMTGYDSFSAKKKMQAVDFITQYYTNKAKGKLTNDDKIKNAMSTQGYDISDMFKADIAMKNGDKDKNGSLSKQEAIDALRKADIDDDSKYISMAYKYLSGRKVTYKGKYDYFSKLSAIDQLRFIEGYKSSIISGINEDY